jgi:hypothetical protein
MNEAPTVLRVYEGGKEVEPTVKPDWQGGGRDWLRNDRAYNDRFLSSRIASPGEDFDQFAIAFITPEAILLAELQPTGMNLFRWVDSMKFSARNRFVALLPDPMVPDKEAGQVSKGDVYNEHHLLGPADGKDHDGHEGPTPDLSE